MLHPARILAAVALAAGLAACGGQKEQEPTETASSEAAAPAPAAAEAAPTTAPTTAASEAATAPTPVVSAPAASPQPAAAAAKAPPVSFALCRTCHAVEPGKNGIGPTLAGIVGSKAGDVPGYQFSPALKQSGVVWSRATLDQWLSGPPKMVPGTKMVISVPDPAKRKEIIDYLETLK